LKILVGYDGSSNAKKAVETVADMAKKLEASVTIVTAAWETSEDESHAMLSGQKRLLEQKGIKVDIRSVRSNNPPGVLVRIAEDEDYDLVVVGSRGMGGVKNFLMGSVSTKIVQDCPCNVLVIKE
jgi:nucleotide-binding universal stress UspA family protein